MMNNRVGYRFSPTNEELINFYLKNKILGCLVDDSISEVDIYSYDPKLLPSLSKVKSNDLVWYFFSRPEQKHSGQRRKRRTPSGFWKSTGTARLIKDKGEKGSQIGIMKILVYHEGRSPNGVKTDWFMHVYSITCLPPEQQSTYVICKIIYRGPDGNLLYSANEAGSFPPCASDSGTFPSAGNAVGNLPSAVSEVENFSSGLNSIRKSTVTEMDKRQQNLPSVQRPVVDSKAFRAATFEKMYKLLQNLPSSVRIQGKLDSHAAP